MYSKRKENSLRAREERTPAQKKQLKSLPIKKDQRTRIVTNEFTKSTAPPRSVKLNDRPNRKKQ